MNHTDRNRLKHYGMWAVITGASDGIGKAIANELAESGINLVLVARRRQRLQELSASLVHAFAIETLVIDADLASDDGVAQVLTQTEGLDVGLFVASAGFGTSGEFVTSDLEQELIMVDVNCRAVVAMSHNYAQRFVTQGRGGIVLMSSLVSFQGVARAANYAATKAFIQSFAEGLSRELAPSGVDVLASAPGPVASGFAETANMEMGATLTPEIVAKETLKALGRRTTVRPGWLTKFLDTSLSFLPRQGRVWAMSRVMGSMTAHQKS